MYMNVTIIIGIILLILGVRFGYRTGLAKGIAHLVALLATLITLALILMLTTSLRAGEARNVIYTLVIMVVLGGVYGLVRFLLRSMKAISNLPIIKLGDKILGIFIGLLWVFVLYNAIITLGIKGYLGPLSSIISRDVESNSILTILLKYNIFC